MNVCWIKFIKLYAAVIAAATCLPCCQPNKADADVLPKAAAASTPPPVSFIKENLEQIQASKKWLDDGVLVTRSDNDFESLTLMNFLKREKVYSHAGILFKEDSSYYVYHSITGAENPAGTCRRDPYDSFVNPLRKTGFGLFKYNLSEREKERFHQFFKKHYAAKTPFDIYFNLKKSDSMYCSEIVYKGLQLATTGRINMPTSVMNDFKPKIMGYKYNNTFFKTFPFIGIDDLYLNRFCKELVRIKYK